MSPLSPQRKWQAITVATLVLFPGYMAMLAGLVSGATDAERGDVGEPQTAVALAAGVALIPFVFIVLAFMSQHPRPPTAVLKAMGLSLLVGIPVSAIAGDAVTGIVAGVGAGGIVSLRADIGHDWRSRAIAVALASAYTFVLVRTAGPIALLAIPALPLTGVGVADHVSERRHAAAS
jgi:hypothetical protein